MQKFAEILEVSFIGTAVLGELFIMKHFISEDPNEFEAEPLPYAVDVFYLDSKPKRQVLTFILN